jgi:hypothetical protein
MFGHGGRIASVAIPYDPTPLIDAMVEAELARFRETFSRNASWWQGEAGQRRAFMDSLYRPRNIPPVDRLLIGNDTIVWVRHAPAHTAATATWAVFDPRGRRIATAELPREFTGMAASGRGLWGVEEDGEGSRLVSYTR